MKKNTIRFIFISLMLLLVLSACAPQAAVDQAPADQDAAESACPEAGEDVIVDMGCREVKIAVENAYPPFNYVNPESGEAEGWDYDTWNEICRRLNCQPVFVETAWEGFVQSVSDGLVDVGADGLTITDARAEIVDFSMPYVDIEQRLLVRKGEDRFDSIDDIVANPEFRLGTQSGSTNYEAAIKYLPEDRIQAYEQFPFVVQSLLAGDLDAVVIDEYAGMGYLGVNADELELIGGSLESEGLGFAYPKDGDWVGPVDQALQSMMDDGWFDDVNAKYFSPDFE
jgi:polar amino acid transport system substrate-binding protein